LIQQISAQRPDQFLTQAAGKFNLNYDNTAVSATNFISWDPAGFFNNVANVLLRSQFNFGVTNIPVYPTNMYSQTVHRLLQMVANIYDATQPANDFPSVFVPEFGSIGGWVYITNYHEINHLANNVPNPNSLNSAKAWLANNTNGIPLVLGAKKGLPNFNEYVMQTSVQAVRKLELRRPTTNSPPNMTNEMFILSVSNRLAVEGWNSYTQAYGADLTLELANNVQVGLTNADGLAYGKQDLFSVAKAIPANTWTGFRPTFKGGGFQIPLDTNSVTLTNSVYRIQPAPHFDLIGQNTFQTGVGYSNPRWILTVSNRLTFILSSKGTILDFVHLPHIDTFMDISSQLMGTSGDPSEPSTSVALCWRTNRFGNSVDRFTPTEGVLNQIEVSLGQLQLSQTDWSAYNANLAGSDMKYSIDSFRAFFNDPRIVSLYPGAGYFANSNLFQQAPFTPTRKFNMTTTWQANDPLVHYMVDDLKDFTNNTVVTFLKPIRTVNTNELNIGLVNDRYKPWGGNIRKSVEPDPLAFEIGVKDPGVMKSDDWNFPTNKYANIGLLGRVHRGSPWQTVYLKAERVPDEVWLKQSLDLRSHPTNDWRLLDIFTVAPHPNADRLRLCEVNDGSATRKRVVCGAPNVAAGRKYPFAAVGAVQARPSCRILVRSPGSYPSHRLGRYFGRG
jgi:tRNA-binding EMAP/Myf-like protein